MSAAAPGSRGRWRRPGPARLLALAAVGLGVTAAGAGAAAAAAPGAAGVIRPSQDLVALLRPHVARAAPRRTARARARVTARTPITDARTILPVLDRRGGWVLVALPGRPNGRRGWVSTTGTLRASTPWHLVVDLSRRRVTAYRTGRRVRAFQAIVGAAITPTPRGTFFVEESIALRPDEVGGPFALALSARSNVLQEFAGGPGQIALHGLDGVGGTLGQALSHGCVRLADRSIRWLVRRIGPGVPVTIER